MNNLSPTISLSLMILLFALGAFAIVRFGGFSLEPEQVSIFAPEERTTSFFSQEDSRVEESRQYIPTVIVTVGSEVVLTDGETLGSTAVLYPYALQNIRRETGGNRIAILEYSSESNTWEILEVVERQVDARYLSSVGIPMNDARQLMRLFVRL